MTVRIPEWVDQPAIFNWDRKWDDAVFRREDENRVRLTFLAGELSISDVPTLAEIEAGADLTSFLENYNQMNYKPS